MTTKLFLNNSGDTGKVCIHVEDSDSNPLDLGLYTAVKFILKRMASDPDDAAVFTADLDSNLALLAPTDDGVAEVTIPASTVSTMRVLRPYPWRLELTNGTGEKGSVRNGTLTILT